MTGRIQGVRTLPFLPSPAPLSVRDADAPVVRVRDLAVEYPGGRRAVDDVTFSVPAGGVLGLLGNNGAGKSTTMRVLAGALTPTAGQVLIGGHDVADVSQADAARGLIGYSPSPVGLAPMLTVRECIGLALAAGRLGNRWPDALALAERLAVDTVLDERTHTFSHGMARRVSVLIAVLTSSSLLLLDEPFDGVDAVGSRVVCELITEAAAAGVAVVVSTHLLDLATDVCDQVAVMVDGRIVGASDAARLAGRRGAARYGRMLVDGLAKAAA